MRYTTQVNEIQIEAPGGAYDLAVVPELKSIFDVEYTRLYGEGSAYPDAGYAIAGVTVRGSARISGYTLGDRPVTGNGHVVLRVARDPLARESGLLRRLPLLLEGVGGVGDAVGHGVVLPLADVVGTGPGP
jgi:hypothetical protein